MLRSLSHMSSSRLWKYKINSYLEEDLNYEAAIVIVAQWCQPVLDISSMSIWAWLCSWTSWPPPYLPTCWSCTITTQYLQKSFQTSLTQPLCSWPRCWSCPPWPAIYWWIRFKSMQWLPFIHSFIQACTTTIMIYKHAIYNIDVEETIHAWIPNELGIYI